MIKKAILIGAIALSCLPLIARADLITNNNTDEPSTVKITTGVLKLCSGGFDGGITPAREMNHRVPQDSVKRLCTGSGNKCRANLYASSNCSGDVVGVAELDLDKKEISVVDSSHPRYVIKADKSTIEINYR